MTINDEKELAREKSAMENILGKRQREPEMKLPTSAVSSKKQEAPRKTFISTLLIMLKPLTMWITTNWKIL